jgi:5-methylcytosine-specific restriction endonuclease McrA
MNPFCKCGSNKIENRDLSLCATCNAKRRKPAKRTVTVYEIPKQSEKKKVRESKLAKVRQEKKKQVKYCETCGKTGVTLTYSHILSVKQYPEYESNKENALLECMPCHHTYEHGTLEEKMKQSTWNRKLAFILANEPQHWNKMQLKSSTIT